MGFIVKKMKKFKQKINDQLAKNFIVIFLQKILQLVNAK